MRMEVGPCVKLTPSGNGDPRGERVYVGEGRGIVNEGALRYFETFFFKVPKNEN